MLKAVDDVRKETPPRVWGRHKFFPAIPLGFRNTPTHVGKTVIRIRHMALAQKHPHACGEDTPTWTMLLITLETPPRMWGRHNDNAISIFDVGNTPTHVGKTTPPLGQFCPE